MEDNDENNNDLSRDTSNASASVTVTIPLNITVSLGSLGSASAVTGVSVRPAGGTTEPGEDLLEKITPDQNYEGRPGYDPDFSGL